MATGETGFDDVTYDLISVQYHALKGGHDYGQYVRDAENAAGRTSPRSSGRSCRRTPSEAPGAMSFSRNCLARVTPGQQ